ncbi:MAG TPA: M15 family metallopeptidase [Polyangiales bacterium]|nr:M15 family metallopeptidase [Polyangiales bacterium]
MEDVSRSVGVGGSNIPADVRIVQRLLNARGFPSGAVDGQFGPRTRKAIIAFQGSFMRKPDGLIEPHGITIRRLNEPFSVLPDPVSLIELVPLPAAATLNVGVRPAKPEVLREVFGAPRESYTTHCQPVTNARLRKRIQTEPVGHFRATGIDVALRSLQSVMSEIEQLEPRVYDALGSAGMLCCRWVRGSQSSVSNHSWGTAIDLTLDGALDVRGNRMVQYGLTLIAPIFNRHGWYWGAGFSTEDAMHFEAGHDLVLSWR